jgi:hypothetical protein
MVEGWEGGELEGENKRGGGGGGGLGDRNRCVVIHNGPLPPPSPQKNLLNTPLHHSTPFFLPLQLGPLASPPVTPHLPPHILTEQRSVRCIRSIK